MWLFSFPPDDFFPDFSSFSVILLFSYIPSYKSFNFYELGSSDVFLLWFFPMEFTQRRKSFLVTPEQYGIALSLLFGQKAKWEAKWKCANSEAKGTNPLGDGHSGFAMNAVGCVRRGFACGCGCPAELLTHLISGAPLKGRDAFEPWHRGELQESTWPLSCLWVQPGPTTPPAPEMATPPAPELATPPGHRAGHAPSPWAGHAPRPLNWLHVVCCSAFLNLWMPHVRGHHTEMPLLSSCWRRLKWRLRQRSRAFTVLLIHNHHWRLFGNLTLYRDCFLCKRSVCRAPQDNGIKRRH